MKKIDCSPSGGEWQEIRQQIFTQSEIAESNLRVAIIAEMVKARNEKGLSQRQLGELSGVKQPAIARLERGEISPHIDTLLKVLAPLGKTLAVVPMESA